MDLEKDESSLELVKEDLERIFELLVDKCEFLIRRLKDFVAFPTVSSDPSKSETIHKMANYLVEILKKFGLKSSILPMTFDEIKPDDPPPPLILAETVLDPTKRTVCFYGHFDVNPLSKQDFWYSDPFELTCSNDNTMYYGKGASIGKGPFLCLINAIGAYQQLNIALPINVKLVLDPMGVSGGELTGKFLRKTTIEFFRNIDFVCMCVGHWFGNSKPCVSHGSRGLCHFSLEIEGPSKDLHSGSYGGLINEPMTDLVYMLNQLVDRRGNIKINDIYEDVVPVTKDEADYYNNIQFLVRDFKQNIGAQELLVNEDKRSLLINLWRMPSLTIHGVEQLFCYPKGVNVIPGKVIGKFSIHIVSNMTPSKVKKKVCDYLSKTWKSRKSTNRIRVQMTVGKQAWLTDPTDPNCRAAVKAVCRVYDERPDLIRESDRVRMANTLRRVTNASVIGIPIGKANDVSDITTEKIDLINYINGSKTFAAYMHEISKLAPAVVPQENTVCLCRTNGVAECICYLKTVGALEEEDDKSTLEGSIAITSTDTEYFSGQDKPEEPASTRFFTYSKRVEKKVRTLRNIIAEGEMVIGSKYGKEVVDTEVLMEDEETGSIHDTNNAIQRPLVATSKKQPIAKSLISKNNESVRLQEGREDQSTLSMQLNIGDRDLSSDRIHRNKTTAQKTNVTSGINDQSSSFYYQENVLQRSGPGPTELNRVDKGSVTFSTFSEMKPPYLDVSTATIQQGYIGKKPYMLQRVRKLDQEPYTIISSLSALLYKRRADKMDSASVKTLPGSRMIEDSRRDEEATAHQIFMTIDHPPRVSYENPKRESQSSAKLRLQRKSTGSTS